MRNFRLALVLGVALVSFSGWAARPLSKFSLWEASTYISLSNARSAEIAQTIVAILGKKSKPTDRFIGKMPPIYWSTLPLPAQAALLSKASPKAVSALSERLSRSGAYPESLKLALDHQIYLGAKSYAAPPERFYLRMNKFMFGITLGMTAMLFGAEIYHHLPHQASLMIGGFLGGLSLLNLAPSLYLDHGNTRKRKQTAEKQINRAADLALASREPLILPSADTARRLPLERTCTDKLDRLVPEAT